MPHCDPYRDQLLDFVFGLLEADEVPALQQHLAGCPACQAALEKARGQQKLLTRAAQVVSAEQVPIFQSPAEAPPAAPTLPLRPVVAPAAETPTAPRRFLRPARIAWAAAAAVLLAVGVSWYSYQRGLDRIEDSLAQNRKRVQQIEAELASLKPSFDRDQKAILETHKAEHLHVQVMGAQRIHPVAGGIVHVALRDLEGKPASGKLHYELRRPTDEQVLRRGEALASGDTQLVLPAVPEMAGQSLEFVLIAESARTSARLKETLTVPAPNYAAHLLTNKATYRAGDVLRFSALALDSYSLTPPSTPLSLQVELVDPNGTSIESFRAVTAASGVIAGEFAVARAWPEGNYTLRVRAGRDATSVVQGHSLRLALVGESTPEIEFDREEYRSGDGVVVTLRRSMKLAEGKKTEADKLAIPDRVLVNGQSVPTQKLGGFAGSGAGMLPSTAGTGFGGGFAGGGFGGIPGSKDAAAGMLAPPQSFRFQLPPTLPSNKARVEIPLGEGGASVVRDVPVAPAKLTVDFFPEGGDLVAGVPNRVYFRVRALDGSLAAPEGHVIVLSKDSVVYDSERQQSLGYFDFTPSASETYSVRLTSPLGVTEIAQPFQRSPLQADGITMRVANSVAREGEPIRVVFHQRGANRRLFVTAHCRGQLVAQHWVDLQKSEQTLDVTPTLSARGVLRITAHESVDGKLIPVAERLVFRATEPLSLAIAGDKAGLRAKSGSTLDWKVESRDAQQQPAFAWAQAAVVAERFRGREHSLAASFQLFGEVRGLEEIDNAILLVNESPEAWLLLDRFLGTYGWRRFAREEVTQLAQLPRKMLLKGGAENEAVRAAAPLLFSRENESLARQVDQYQAEVEKSIEPLRAQSARRHSELAAEKASALQSIAGFSRAASDFRQRPREYLQMGLGVLFVALLVASVVMMGIAFYRLARRTQATGSFGGAFVGLLASLLIVMISSSLGQVEVRAPGGADMAPQAGIGRDVDAFLRQIGNLPRLSRPAATPAPSGYFAMAVQPKDDTARLDQETRVSGAALDTKQKADGPRGAALQVASAPPATTAAVARMLSQDLQRGGEKADRNNLASENAKAMSAPGMGGVGGGPFAPGLPNQPRLGAGNPAASPPGGVKEIAPSPPPLVEKKNDAKGKGGIIAEPQSVRREFAYKHAAGLLSDTLLWQPSLALKDGSGALRFDAGAPGSYRVLLWAHTPDGRFGFYQNRLAVGR